MRQCGNCKFALGFDYPESPGGPTDGVMCSSADIVNDQEEMSGNTGDFAMQYQKDGYVLLWRLEVLAEPEFECPHWQP